MKESYEKRLNILVHGYVNQIRQGRKEKKA